MQFTTILALLGPLAAFAAAEDAITHPIALEREASAEAVTVPDVSLAARGEGSLAARACNYNGCRCKVGLPQGQYCGNCVLISDGSWAITNLRNPNHIYECNPSGGCCSYGYAGDCGGLNARCR
ncbi:hypothetical protein MN608_08437 [Microdochium nivale]|nr:hypothetical protein MN608_08437 [Microdochium nivale]